MQSIKFNHFFKKKSCKYLKKHNFNENYIIILNKEKIYIDNKNKVIKIKNIEYYYENGEIYWIY